MKDFAIKGVEAQRPLLPGDGIFGYLRPGYSVEIKNIKVVVGSVASPPPGSVAAAHSINGRAHMEVLDQPPDVSCMNCAPMKYSFKVPPQRYGCAVALIKSALDLLGSKVTSIHNMCSEYKEDNIFTQHVDVIRLPEGINVVIRDETLAFGNALARYIYNADISVSCYCEALDASALGISLTINHPAPVDLLLSATKSLSADIRAMSTAF
jgi:hypothetical protein